MRTTLVVLAVTKMRAGFCVAGIDPATGGWVRPVKDFGSLRLGDISYRDRTPIRPLDKVTLDLVRPRPSPPHVEDWQCDFLRRPPDRAGTVADDELAAALDEWAEPDADAVLARHERSLALVRAAPFALTSDLDAATGRLDVRLDCPELGLARTPVTDLRARALARQGLIGESATSADLEGRFGVARWFVAVGLSREFDGRIWPLVVGLHAVPGIPVTVDYARP